MIYAVIAASCVLAVGLILYGLLRRFARMSWFFYQTLLLFAISLLIPLIAKTESAIGNYLIAIFVLLGGGVLVLIGGELIRRAMIMKKSPAPPFVRFLDRFFGAFTALFDVAMIAVMVGGTVLVILPQFVQLDILNALYENPLWQTLGVYTQDLLLTALALLFVRAGYRIGLVRSVQTVFMLALILVSAFFSYWLVRTVPFLKSFSGAVAGWFPINDIIAGTIADLIVTLLCFLVFLAVILVLGKLFNVLLLKMRSIKGIAIVDGCLLAAVFFALFVGFNLGLNFAVGYLAEGIPGLSEEINTTIMEIATKIGNAFCSSPLSKLLFESNPILAAIP